MRWSEVFWERHNWLCAQDGNGVGVSGVDSAAPVVVSGGADTDGKTVVAPSLTVPSGGGRMVVFTAAQSHPVAVSWTAAAGMVKRADMNTLAYLSAAVMDQAVVAGATGTRTATFGADTALTVIDVVLKPGTGGGTTTTSTSTTVASTSTSSTTSSTVPAGVADESVYQGDGGPGDSPAFTLTGSAGALVVKDWIVSLPGGVNVNYKSTAPTVPSWSYPSVHGDLLAVTGSTGSKVGSTYRWDPDGMPIAGTAQPNLLTGNFENGWLGQHQRMTDTSDTANPVIEMGARPYAPGIVNRHPFCVESGG